MMYSLPFWIRRHTTAIFFAKLTGDYLIYEKDPASAIIFGTCLGRCLPGDPAGGAG
jgi:hypothetical protein